MDIEKEGIIMDNLVIGLIVILALAYLGTKIYKQVSGKGGCGCGSGGSNSGSKKSSGCGGSCSCDGSNKALGIKRTAKQANTNSESERGVPIMGSSFQI